MKKNLVIVLLTGVSILEAYLIFKICKYYKSREKEINDELSDMLDSIISDMERINIYKYEGR